MKKVLFYAGVMALTAALASCEKKDDSSSATDGKIGGVTWAATNVDDYQTFAARPDMYTKFYQWNKSTAWAATGNVTGWNPTPDTSPTWTINPCPAGWRLPTRTEFEALDNAGSTWADANAKGNAVAGRFYGANLATATMSNLAGCIFLPAVGFRFRDELVPIFSNGTCGSYWSSTSKEYSNTDGYYLFFIGGDRQSGWGGGSDKGVGMSIRCVKD